jgi:hypothetical protein
VSLMRLIVGARIRTEASCAVVGLSFLLVFALPLSAQTVVGSARVICAGTLSLSGPIVGAIINQTDTTITDFEVELSIVTRDKKGQLKRQRDTRFVVIPSLNQTHMVTKLPPNGDVYFSIPARQDYYDASNDDRTCAYEVPNVATLAIRRINGKSLSPLGRDGKPLKQAPLDSMLQVPRETPEHVPTQREIIQGIRENNELLRATIINKQLQDCLARGAWACSFNNDTNINVVISQQ